MPKIGIAGKPPLEDPTPLALPGPDPASEDAGSDETPELSPPVVIPKALVVYMTGDMGPFKCSNCCYFSNPNGCSVVEGEIDPEGCCNMYCPPNHDTEGAVDEEAAEPVDNPEEEAAEGEEPPVA